MFSWDSQILALICCQHQPSPFSLAYALVCAGVHRKLKKLRVFLCLEDTLLFVSLSKMSMAVTPLGRGYEWYWVSCSKEVWGFLPCSCPACVSLRMGMRFSTQYGMGSCLVFVLKYNTNATGRREEHHDNRTSSGSRSTPWSKRICLCSAAFPRTHFWN